MKDQHYKVAIEVRSNERISFVTDYGWAEKLDITLDCMNLEDAITSTVKFLGNLQIVPFGNDPGNEDYVLEAINNTVQLSETIKDLKVVADGKVSWLLVFPHEIKIEFTESYVVDFGSESET